MKRFNVDAIIEGVKVTFGVENSHIVLFHDKREWDDDAKNKLGIKSGRKRRYSSDLGIAPCPEPDNKQLAVAVGVWKPGVKVVFESVASVASQEPTTAQTAAIPQPQQPQPQAVIPTSTNVNIVDGVASLFGGIAQQIKGEVMAEIEPKLNQYQQINHVIKINSNGAKVIKGVVHERFDDVLKLVSVGQPVYLYGPSGTGKSHIGPQIADALELDYYQLDKIEHVHDLVGFVDGYGKFHETPFTTAFTHGGLVLWDEYDGSAPDAALKGNGIAQGCVVFGDGVAHKAHPNFRIIATGNTNGQGATEEFTARYQMDVSSLNRFVKIDYGFDANIERAMVNGDMDLLDFVHQVRVINKQKHITMSLGYHNIKGLKQCADLLGIEKAIRYNVVNSLDNDTARILLNALPEYDTEWFKGAKKVLKTL